MKKQNIVGSCQSLGTSPSPEAGSYRHQDKGWSSERVPPPSGSSNNIINNGRRRRRRHASALTTPFYSGRQLPSKWEDAERWICSPVLGYGVAKNATYSRHPHHYPPYQRSPKSKSGPILPPLVVVSSSSSSFEGSCARNFLVTASSPFTTGVLMPYGVGVGGSNFIGGGGGGDTQVENEPRSSGMPGWSDMVSDPSLPTSRDEKLEDINDAENSVTRVISRRDMATQMSPRSSSNSSPPSILPLVELKSDQNAKLNIREVQVDKRASIVSWSKRHSSCLTTKALPDVDDFNRNPRDSCSWDISEAASDFSKLQRQEAKITAWENLQKAKAEAAIRKLEMKLEKKRSSSMDKILSKLKIAQSRAQEMRSSMTVLEDLQTSKKLKRITCSRKRSLFCSFQGCFT